MIINENNKNRVMQGMIQRGFNQTPADIQKKLNNINQMNMNKTKINEPKPNQDYHDIITKMNELRRNFK